MTERKKRDLADVLSGRHRFSKRTAHACDRNCNVTAYVPWGMQIRMWLGLGCKNCGRKLWLFSCRYRFCKPRSISGMVDAT